MASDEFRNKLMSLQGNLLNYAFMLTSHREMARRLLDCTTKTALEQWAEASDDASLKSWAFSIMRGVFASEFAFQKTEQRKNVDVYAIRLTDESEVVCARSEGIYSSADVTQALQSLGQDYRRTVELYFAGYTVVEISSEMNLPVSVVRSRVAYCRNHLRMVLSA